MSRPLLADPVMAQRWQVSAHLDDNTCDPCRNNHRKTYRNRREAYEDYPGGRGFKDCVGAQYGNKCRCTVVKRGKKGQTNTMTPEQIATLTERIRLHSETMSARAFTQTEGPAQKLTMRAAAATDDGSGATQVYLYDYIGGWDGVKAADVVMMLAELTGPIDLHINSGGGSIFEGAAIFNAFLNYAKNKGTVTSYIDGVAASAASFIALAASPYDPDTKTGGVVCEATATLMTHDGQGMAIGTAATMREVADLLDMLSNTIAGIYARKTGKPAAEWREVMEDGDTWYTAKDGLAAGLVDRIANGDPDPDEPDEDPTEASNALDLGVFDAWTQVSALMHAETDKMMFAPQNDPAPAGEPKTEPTAFDFAGMSTALKGLLA